MGMKLSTSLVIASLILFPLTSNAKDVYSKCVTDFEDDGESIHKDTLLTLMEDKGTMCFEQDVFMDGVRFGAASSSYETKALFSSKYVSWENMWATRQYSTPKGQDNYFQILIYFL